MGSIGMDVAPPNLVGMVFAVVLFSALFAAARYLGDLSGDRPS
jgi:hypothetical protein